MTKNARIEREIEKTLQRFEKVERLKANPYFYTRLQARIKDLEKRKRFSIHELLRLKFMRPAMLTAIILFNIVTAVVVFQRGDKQTDYRDQYLTALAEEYSLSQGSRTSFFE